MRFFVNQLNILISKKIRDEISQQISDEIDQQIEDDLCDEFGDEILEDINKQMQMYEELDKKLHRK